MTNPEYCPDCDRYGACECAETNARFKQGNVDPQTWGGFNPPLWAYAVLNEGPVRIDLVSDAFWEYDSGVWRESRKVVAKRLPVLVGRNYRRQDTSHVSDYLYARLLRDGEVIHPDTPDTRYVSVPSGLFDIATCDVVPHDPLVLTTYQLKVDPVFDAPTPEFDRFLDSVLHPGDRDRVLDILSYLLLPGNPRQKAVMLSGSGRNGKGVLLNLVEAIIGRENSAHVSLQEMSTRFAAVDLYGKPVNIVGDIDGEHITHTGRFKQITGDDTVRMDVKSATAFAAKVWAVPVFSANQIPTSADTSHGYLRRWEVVEFPNTFDGSDTTLLDRLTSELPAIAGKLLARAAANPFQIRDSEPGKRAHDTFANRSDPVRTWLSETELSGFQSRADTYADYKQWIEDGNGKTALTKQNFYARVSAVLGEPKTRRGVRGWELPTIPELHPEAHELHPRGPVLHPDCTPIPDEPAGPDVAGAKGASPDNSSHICSPAPSVPSDSEGLEESNDPNASEGPPDSDPNDSEGRVVIRDDMRSQSAAHTPARLLDEGARAVVDSITETRLRDHWISRHGTKPPIDPFLM
ncbi:phage/plasmid primase, P4 family [Nocardia rhamnosiphila]|uniref:DNA primase family protein n=1 Tax=Nocardia rhamnosiphila TaxID=426716 RepID=UPI003404C144